MSERKTILIVDDEVDLLKVLQFRLEEKGYYVVTAQDGEEGLEVANRVMPDLIVLDMNMPKKDGLEFYRDISTGHGRPKFPILVLTARGELEDLFKIIKADGFMAKPFEINELLKEVERITKATAEANVLLIDSENLMSSQITRSLEQNRYRVTMKNDLEAFKNQVTKEIPDFIVMEYMQRDLAGEKFITEIRKILSSLPGEFVALRREVPIVVYSRTGMDYKDKSLHAGANAYVGKPNHFESIVTAIRGIEMKRKASEDRQKEEEQGKP